MKDNEENYLAELQRVAWIYAKLIGRPRVCIRIVTGTDDGLGECYPNLGKWAYHVDIGTTTFCGTVVSCTFQIRELADKILGKGYL